MLAKPVEQAMNDQIKWEMWSGYLYLSMAAWFEDQGLSGFAAWMRNQSAEELSHAMKMYGFVNETGGRVVLQDIEAPKAEWDSPLAVFTEGLEHERAVTGRINDLVNLAMEHKDHATTIFLQWFVSEQVEEEATFSDIKRKLELVSDGSALYLLDKELSTRVFTWPQPGAE